MSSNRTPTQTKLWHNGWFFTRLSDGAVVIEKRQGPSRESELTACAVIEPDEWASVVAAVSAMGDTPTTWGLASRLHRGMT